MKQWRSSGLHSLRRMPKDHVLLLSIAHLQKDELQNEIIDFGTLPHVVENVPHVVEQLKSPGNINNLCRSIFERYNPGFERASRPQEQNKRFREAF